jgi:hypothetical protein
VIATLFYNPITVSFNSELLMLLPLCAAVGLIYKTIRVEYLSQLPREYVKLLAYMAFGLVALSVLLWATYTYWP